MNYRVPIDDEPPPPTDERVAVIGDTRYMKEEGQWYRLLDIWDLIPQNTEFLNGGRWCKTERVGEKVEDYDFQYRVPCDPPHGAFGGFLKPLPITFTPLPEVVWQDMCMKAHKERDQLLVRYQSLKAEHLKALEVIENIRDALTAKDA